VSLPVAVLAGGLATRLRPLTERIPKILLPLAGRTFAEHQLDLLRNQGIKQVVYCLGYLGEQVGELLGDGRRWGMEFTYVFDGPALLGTGGALAHALPHLGPAFFVMYGDSYLRCDFNAVERTFASSRKPGLMTVFRNDDRWDRSNVDYRSGQILRYDKTAAPGTLHYIDYGLGVLTPEAFRPWAGGTERFDLSDVYRRLVDTGALAGHEVDDRFYEIGSAEGLSELQALLETKERTSQ